MCCDKAPPHTGCLRQNVLWEKSVCLFSPFIVMLIIRNWRRCILASMELEVPPPQHLSPSVHRKWKKRRDIWILNAPSWVCDVLGFDSVCLCSLSSFQVSMLERRSCGIFVMYIYNLQHDCSYYKWCISSVLCTQLSIACLPVLAEGSLFRNFPLSNSKA